MNPVRLTPIVQVSRLPKAESGYENDTKKELEEPNWPVADRGASHWPKRKPFVALDDHHA